MFWSTLFGSQILLLFTVGYVLLCRLLRYRRMNEKHAQYPYTTRESFAKMTTQHAYEIQKYLYSLEFPFTTEKGLQFALFRTYGIPTISKLLVQTKQLSEKEHASRRYVDTTVLIGEFMSWAPDAERTNAAIARMNFLHSLYQKKNLISNDDMLYTLSLFALEPVRWVQKYEWRAMTEMETCAMGTFWKSIGDAMNISYADLPSFIEGWKDGLEWLHEVQVWSNRYEERCMVPDVYNKKTANETTALLLYDVPEVAIPAGRTVISALMDNRLRKAMMYPTPPSWVQSAVESVLQLRKLGIRYLALPRPQWLRYDLISENPAANGRYHLTVYEHEPWYIEPNFRNRWSFRSLIKWLSGKPIPGKAAFQSEGYLIHEVGPKSLEGMGMKEFELTKDKLMKAGRGGCPFSVMK